MDFGARHLWASCHELNNLKDFWNDKLSIFDAVFVWRRVSLALCYPISQNWLFGVFAWSKF
jgi:hypothetical protein